MTTHNTIVTPCNTASHANTHLHAPQPSGDVPDQKLLDQVLDIAIQVSGPVNLPFQDLLVYSKWMLIKEGWIPGQETQKGGGVIGKGRGGTRKVTTATCGNRENQRGVKYGE